MSSEKKQQVRSKTPRLILGIVLLVAVTAGLSFVFPTESAQFRGFITTKVKQLLTKENVDIETNQEHEEVETRETERPDTIPIELDNIDAEEDQAQDLLAEALWFEDAGNIPEAKKYYNECITSYALTKSAKSARKFLATLDKTPPLIVAKKPEPVKPQPPPPDAKNPLPEVKTKTIPKIRTGVVTKPKTKIAEADDFYLKGLAHQKIALDNRPSALSNREFKKAEILFRKALKIYYKEYKKTKSSEVEKKMVKTNEQLYNTIKYPTLK